ncbi:MAG: RnfABCDGE type electron transport complex subunit B [Woeseiaceae bacterium]|nr:RnfABCDGE type electron transport complex subunit B [Woeseiaceae bacterium]
MLTAILTAISIISVIALAAGLMLIHASRTMPGDAEQIVEEVNALLPQTQCAQCGFVGCQPYAGAIVDGSAPINLCPPGGDDTVARLAELLGRDPLPLAEPAVEIQVAVIDESLCIGCTHCRTACPVDAITGAHQYMHTIIRSECTGCELCIAPCPVDCIRLVST